MNREREYQVTFVHAAGTITAALAWEPKVVTVTAGTPADAAVRAVREHHDAGPSNNRVRVDVAHNDDPVSHFTVVKIVTYEAVPGAVAPIGGTRR